MCTIDHLFSSFKFSHAEEDIYCGMAEDISHYLYVCEMYASTNNTFLFHFI